MDLQIFDNGKGVRYTVVFDKPTLPGEVPAYAITAGTATDAAQDFTKALVLTPAAAPDSSDPSGATWTCDGTIPQPPIDGTGFVVTMTLKENSGNTITDDAAPVDVIVPPQEPTAATITESAL